MVVQNGQVIADGGGTRRVLNLASASRITNSIENPADGGSSGWYARDGGSLLLPPLHVTGSTAYTWGEDDYDSVIDLVNSVRIVPLVRGAEGDLRIALLDPQSSDAPKLPAGNAVGLWKLNTSFDLDGVNLTVRYDDLLAAGMDISENSLRLWVYENDAWHVIADASAGVDSAQNLLWGTANDPLYFAVAPAGGTLALGTVPEPSTLALGLLGAGAMLLRRRR
jgi:hypothetical protein